MWQPEGNKSVQIIRQGRAVSGLAVSADGRLIASRNDDGTVKLWDDRGNLRQNMSKHDREITSVAFSPNGKTIASGGRDKTVNLWDIGGSLINSITDHDDIVDAVDYFPLSNGKLQSNSAVFVSAGWDGNLKFRDRLGNTLRTVKVCNQISTFNFSPDGELMFVGCVEDSTIKILDDSGQLIKILKGHQANVLSIVVDRARSKIISSSINGTIKLWNTDGTLHKNLSGHSSAVWRVDLSPDNRFIATASSDRTIKLWNIDGTLLKTLNGHTQTVNNVVFSPDGKSLISSSDDQTIMIWNLDIVLDTKLVFQQGCNLIRDYLQHNAEVEESDRTLCDDVEQ
ncbi:MAG TPA: WD40 repeat domain-containing protein [Xenococcaceae cyanobacterium]